ncbi:MAG: hypothetical protein HY647_03430 [Acidobacteria bacterium]|nr:hypothetical protein [Acidobacteriota bacterium]
MKRKFGSSEFFIVTAVLFEELEEAENCDCRITELRQRLGVHDRFEFRFNACNQKLRRAFLEAIGGVEFFYFSVVLNKADCGERVFSTRILFTNTPPVWSSRMRNLISVMLQWSLIDAAIVSSGIKLASI